MTYAFDKNKTLDNAEAASDRPVHKAEHLTQGGREARIVLGDQVYTLRITRAGKLILTK